MRLEAVTKEEICILHMTLLSVVAMSVDFCAPPSLCGAHETGDEGDCSARTSRYGDEDEKST